MNALHEIAKTAAGAAVIADWLGSGGHPVSQDTANSRALSCLHGNEGRECPNLVAPNWWQQQLSNPVADAIKKHLEAKNSLKLETALDQVPRMCRVCGCCMPAKVWVPIEHVAAHTSEKRLAEFPAFCWVRIEIENL